MSKPLSTLTDKAGISIAELAVLARGHLLASIMTVLAKRIEVEWKKHQSKRIKENSEEVALPDKTQNLWK